MNTLEQLDEFEQEDLQVIRELWEEYLTGENIMENAGIKKFTVHLQQLIVEETQYDVYASSEDEAKEIAREQLSNDTLGPYWEYSHQVDAPVEAVLVEENLHEWPCADVFDIINKRNNA